MKLDLFDAYNIRVRLSSSIILLAPIAITIFLCFGEIASFASSSVIAVILLAFTNYIPIIQRRLCQNRSFTVNYAARFLAANDKTIDAVTKKRYYRTLAGIDSSFDLFNTPTDSEAFQKCCNSAVLYLRNHTRENALVQEENINYGLCRNLFATKKIGIILCIVLCISIALVSWVKHDSFSSIPEQYLFSFVADFLFLLFWIFGVTRKTLESTAMQYARTLLSTIDSIETLK